MKKKKPDDIDSITVLLVGDEKVWKTQIFNRIFNFEFDSKYEETTEYNSSKKRYISITKLLTLNVVFSYVILLNKKITAQLLRLFIQKLI